MARWWWKHFRERSQFESPSSWGSGNLSRPGVALRWPWGSQELDIAGGEGVSGLEGAYPELQIKQTVCIDVRLDTGGTVQMRLAGPERRALGPPGGWAHPLLQTATLREEPDPGWKQAGGASENRDSRALFYCTSQLLHSLQSEGKTLRQQKDYSSPYYDTCFIVTLALL